MKRILLAFVWVCACSTKESHTTWESHSGPGSAAGSSSASGSGAPAGAADEAALAKVADQVDAGDAWKTAVMKIVAVAGPPNIVTVEGGPELDWFAAGKDSCTVLEVHASGNFVKSVDTSQFSAAADDYKPCMKALTKHATLPALVDPPNVDVEAPARAILAAWHDGRFQDIFDGADPELRDSMGSADTIAHLAKLFEPLAGKFVAPGKPFRYDIKDFSYVAIAPAVFEKGTLQFSLSFRVIDGTPKLTNLNLQLPKELQAKPVNSDAEKLARRALDATLAGKFGDVLAFGADDLVKAVHARPGIVKDMGKLGRTFGKVKSIKVKDQHDCDGRQCVNYEIVGAKARGTAEVVVVFAVSEWEVAGLTLKPAS